MAERSRLPHWLTGIYALLIAYASLQPFSGWTDVGQPYFLFSLPGRYTTFDLLANVCAYFPFGFFAALAWPKRARAIAGAVGFGALLSVAMESLQGYLPARAASNLDVLANVLGTTFGALAGTGLRQHPHWGGTLKRWREAIFLSSRNADAGLALLAIWLMLQINPAIPLFGRNYHPAEVLPVDAAGTLIEAAQTACNVLGVGLLLGSLLRRRSHFGAAMLLLIGSGLLLKGAAALLLIKPAAWDDWLRPGVAIGLAAGSVLLLGLVWSRRRTQTLLGAIALISGLLVPVLSPETILADVPLALFSWHYGHLLNFNGLTHTGLLVWPVAAAIQLILAGTAASSHRADPV